MRYIAIIGFLGVLAASIAYAAPFPSTPTAKGLSGGSDNVTHCQVIDYDIAASDTISSVNANVECDITGSYNVDATVTSGASTGNGTTAASLTANTPLVVAVTISPSVSIGSSTYDADIQVKE